MDESEHRKSFGIDYIVDIETASADQYIVVKACPTLFYSFSVTTCIKGDK